MWIELAGSLLMHGGAAALAMGFMTLNPSPELPAAEVVSVDLVATHSFSTNAKEVIASDATFSASSAGGQPVEMARAEPMKPEPVKPEPIQKPATNVAEIKPLEAREVTPAKPAAREPGLPVLAAAVEPIDPEVETAPEPMDVAAIAPVTVQQAVADAAEAVETTDVPVPMPRLAGRPNEPTKPEPRQVQKKPEPRRQPVQTANAPVKQQATQPNRGGNGGASNADSRASAARSSAAVSNYPGQIVSRLRRALRYPSGTRGSGEAHVQFVVAANGRASAIRVVRSSGDARLDAAAVATVERAAPFPAIPQDAGRNSWTFTVPLAFRR